MSAWHCRLTQRWEASLWLEGRQLYLGGFQTERDAARAYDIAALSCKGPTVVTNYSQDCYTEQLQDTAGCSTVRRFYTLLVHREATGLTKPTVGGLAFDPWVLLLHSICLLTILLYDNSLVCVSFPFPFKPPSLFPAFQFLCPALNSPSACHIVVSLIL